MMRAWLTKRPDHVTLAVAEPAFDPAEGAALGVAGRARCGRRVQRRCSPAATVLGAEAGEPAPQKSSGVSARRRLAVQGESAAAGVGGPADRRRAAPPGRGRTARHRAGRRPGIGGAGDLGSPPRPSETRRTSVPPPRRGSPDNRPNSRTAARPRWICRPSTAPGVAGQLGTASPGCRCEPAASNPRASSEEPGFARRGPRRHDQHFTARAQPAR